MSEHEALTNFVHREVLRVLHRVTRRTPGVVDAYDPKTHAVKMRLMPDSIDGDIPVVTGWVPLHPIQTGKNFGWHMPPNVGDHGWIEFHDLDREAGQFVVASFNDKFTPIPTVQAGEWLYKNKQGSQVYFKNDGSVTVTDKNGNTIILDGSNTLTARNAAGSKVVMSGVDVQVVPGGGTVFLGGTGGDGSYDFVLTNSGPSVNVKAKIG